MTLVLLLTRMLMSGSRRSDYFFGGIDQALRRNDVQTTSSQPLPTLCGMVSSAAHDHRNLYAHRFDGTNDPVCDRHTADDAAEDVDQNRCDGRIRQNDLESLADGFLARAAAHIEEVRGTALVQLD